MDKSEICLLLLTRLRLNRKPDFLSLGIFQLALKCVC